MLYKDLPSASTDDLLPAPLSVGSTLPHSESLEVGAGGCQGASLGEETPSSQQEVVCTFDSAMELCGLKLALRTKPVQWSKKRLCRFLKLLQKRTPFNALQTCVMERIITYCAASVHDTCAAWRCQVQVADFQLSGVYGWRTVHQQTLPEALDDASGTLVEVTIITSTTQI